MPSRHPSKDRLLVDRHPAFESGSQVFEDSPSPIERKPDVNATSFRERVALCSVEEQDCTANMVSSPWHPWSYDLDGWDRAREMRRRPFFWTPLGFVGERMLCRDVRHPSVWKLRATCICGTRLDFVPARQWGSYHICAFRIPEARVVQSHLRGRRRPPEGGADLPRTARVQKCLRVVCTWPHLWPVSWQSRSATGRARERPDSREK